MTLTITSLDPLPEDLYSIILDFLQELVPTTVLLLSEKYYNRVIPHLYTNLVVDRRTIGVFSGLKSWATINEPADSISVTQSSCDCVTRKTLALAYTTSLTFVDYEAAQSFASSLILPINENEREMRSLQRPSHSQTIKLFPSLTNITFDSPLLAALHSINRFDAFRIDFLAALAFTRPKTVTFNLLDIPKASCTYNLPLLLLLNATQPTSVVFDSTLFDAPFLLGNYALRQTSHIRMNLNNAAPKLCIDGNGKPRTKHRKTYRVISAMMAGFAMDTLANDESNIGCSSENKLEIHVKTNNVGRLRKKAVGYLPTYQNGCVEAFKKVEDRITIKCL